MNCSAPLPGDDDGPFRADDPMLPLPGVEPRIEGAEGGALRMSLVVCVWVLLFVACGVALAVAVQS